jgi:hypothetical protein
MARISLNRFSIDWQQHSFRACFGINHQSWGAKKRQRNATDGWPTNRDIVENASRVQVFGTRTQCVNVDVSIATCATLGIHPHRIVRSGFKTFNQVQDQGGARDSSAGIYLIFRVLNPSAQHRNWD